MNCWRRFFAQIAHLWNGDLVVDQFLADHAFFNSETASGATEHVIARQHDHIDLILSAHLAHFHLRVIIQRRRGNRVV